MQRTIDNLDKQDIIIRRNQNVFDNKLKLKDKFIGDYEAQHIHQVVSTGTYGKFKSYHDEFEEILFSNLKGRDQSYKQMVGKKKKLLKNLLFLIYLYDRLIIILLLLLIIIYFH